MLASSRLNEHPFSYYAATGLPQPSRPALAGTEVADVCVVGAGYTGLSTALHLAEGGFRVIVVEAARVGWGASGRNGGQIVHSFSRDVDVIEERYGTQLAQAMGSMIFEGAQIIRERVAQYHIDCHLKDGGVFAALNAKQAQKLEDQKDLWERLGHRQLEFLGTTQTEEIVGSDRYVAALLDHSGGHLHPLRLAQGEAAAFEALGGRIFEQSAVVHIDRGSPAVVHTAQGQVHAKFVVVAGNAYLGDLEPSLASKSMPCGTQVIATEPLGSRWQQILPKDYCVEDCNFLLDYFRLSYDKRLIYGGGVVYGAQEPRNIEALIRPKLERTFAQLRGIRFEYMWSGDFLLTLSRLPQVGRLSNNIYYAQGCSGHGLTFTHLIGRVLCQLIQGHADRFDVFESLPHMPFPGGRAMRVPFSMLGAWYYQLRDKLGV